MFCVAEGFFSLFLLSSFLQLFCNSCRVLLDSAECQSLPGINHCPGYERCSTKKNMAVVKRKKKKKGL